MSFLYLHIHFISNLTLSILLYCTKFAHSNEAARNFDVWLTVRLNITLANDQLDVQNLIHILQSCTCTCFEQYLAHPQEVKLY
jgi:hypothetical protein